MSHKEGQLSGKVIAITGGGRGIGRTIAEFCKKEGALVAVCSRSESELNETQTALAKINSLPSMAVKCDVSRQDQTQNFFQCVHAEWGNIFGVVCAAGVYGSIGPFVKTPFEEWEKSIDINLKGTALSIHEAYPFFDKKRGGRVVLFSGGGQGPLANFSSYAVGKGGIWRLTETLGVELAEENIFLNAVAPGAVNTKFLDELLAAGPEKVGQELYQKSIVQKEQGGISSEKAAELCVWLLSDKSFGLYGKILSAIWDSYKEFVNLDQMSKTDIYQVRRIVSISGGTRA